MKRYLLGTLVVALLLTSTLAGIAQAEKVKLTWTTCCGQKVRHELFQNIANQYMEMNPNVEVEWRYPSGHYTTQMKTLIAAGTAPDVFWIGADIWQFTDLLLPLNDIAEKDPGAKAVNPSLMRMVNFDGKQIAIPYAANAYTMFYNKDHFANAGLGSPSAGWNFDDMVNYAKRLTIDTNGDDENDQFGLSFHDIYVAMHWGGDFYTPDSRKTLLDSPANAAALQFFADLYSGKSDYGTSDSNAYSSGKASMRNIGIFNVPALRSAPFSWDVTDMPVFEYDGEEYRNTYVTLENWAVTKDTKHPEEAKDFVRFLLSSEVMEQVAASGIAIPSQQRTAMDFVKSPPPPENMMAFIRALDHGPLLAANHPIGADIWSWINSQEGWSQMRRGETPAAAVLPELAKGINQMLDEFWAKRK